MYYTCYANANANANAMNRHFYVGLFGSCWQKNIKKKIMWKSWFKIVKDGFCKFFLLGNTIYLYILHFLKLFIRLYFVNIPNNMFSLYICCNYCDQNLLISFAVSPLPKKKSILKKSHQTIILNWSLTKTLFKMFFSFLLSAGFPKIFWSHR